MRWVKFGALEGLALRRFDIIAGTQFQRQTIDQAGGVAVAAKQLDAKDKILLMKYHVLAEKLGILHTPILITYHPEVYMGIGDDNFDLAFPGSEGPVPAPFIGGAPVKKKRREDLRHEAVTFGYSCGIPMKKNTVFLRLYLFRSGFG